MKQKKFFKENEFVAKTAATLEELKPVYQKSVNRIKSLAEKKPYRTLALMIAIAILNLMLLIFWSYRKAPVNFGFSKINFEKTKESIMSSSRSDIPFTLGNYMEVKSLKDSLDYLMSKKQLTREDTLLFIRICQQYSKLDPHFSSKILNRKP